MIVLDTNVVSEAMRPEPDPSVLRWLNTQAADTLYLSSVTLAELLFGITALPDGARKHRLAQALDRLLALFPNRVLPFDQEAARRYADMVVAAREAGRPLPTADGYLAATAAAHGFVVATRNIQHFEDTGVELINPWDHG
ncbi:type II toxin-antitoxin system VapC family toxin [Nesterenkonia ebinurensis]|uniref:type II toxin-antitoxin system VapC family toxin n=1 Tax=Nesterenkonia ebinurensis TaxID=2608252 RepID=UPI00123D8311|nr:type II toxin-antitoxin system VapC family toxin [Nesterenkonia ebinurensis]